MSEGIARTTSDNKNMKIYHLAAYHDNFELDGAQHALDIIGEYIDLMKQNEVYNNSTIIVVADHGNSDAGSMEITRANVPVLMVKRTYESHTEYLRADSPVSQEGLLNSISEILEVYSQKNGLSFWDYRNEEKARTYYHTALFSDMDGEVELREYQVDGDANDLESYYYTGNRWEIKYSENKVKQ